MQTTIDIYMTSAQEKAIEWALARIRSMYFHGDTYRFRTFEVHGCPDGEIRVSVTTDNGIPGTFGYVIWKHHHFFIGKRGGVYSFREPKTKRVRDVIRVRGVEALFNI